MKRKTNASKKIKIIKNIVFAFLIICIVWVFGKYHSSKHVNFYLEKDFSGIIKDKYIDTKNHNFKIIVIRNNKEIDLSVLPDELFEEILVGDSISKIKNELVGNIYRNGKKIIIVDYGRGI